MMFMCSAILPVLLLAALLQAVLAQQETCSAEETPPDALGPFFVEDMPLRRELAPVEQLNDPSLRLEVSGTIYGNDCVPMAGVLVEPWYAGVLQDGAIDYSDGLLSNDFRGRIFTDECGRYDFVATFPESYPQRPILHIHFRVSDSEQEFLTTQMYFEGLIIPGFNPADNQIMPVTTASDGSRSGVFDIALKVPGTADASACEEEAPLTRAPTPSPTTSTCPDRCFMHPVAGCLCKDKQTGNSYQYGAYPDRGGPDSDVRDRERRERRPPRRERQPRRGDSFPSSTPGDQRNPRGDPFD